MEEAQLLRDIKTYDQWIERRLDSAAGGQGYHWIRVPGLLEKRPSVLRGDFVWLTQRHLRRSFKSWVHKTEDDRVCVHLPFPFDNSPPFEVRFSFPRTPYRNMHMALEESIQDVFSTAENFELMVLRGRVTKAFQDAHSSVLSRGVSRLLNFAGGATQPSSDDMQDRVDRLSQRLNFEQILFVEAVLAPVSKPFPILCWGPPGTGKTTAVCESIHELLSADTEARCLVCCPSNGAVDILCERLASLGVQTGAMVRLNARSRKLDEVPERVLPFCPRRQAQGALDDDEAEWFVPQEGEYSAYRIILTTCSFAATVLSSFQRGSSTLKRLISHCFIDEAGQTMEPEAWIPLCLLKPGGKSFFIGDHRQLGSTVHNPFASKMGLETSIQERLWEALGGGTKTNSTRCFALLDSYRSHPSILRLFNAPIYAGMLRCCTDVSTVKQFEDMGSQGHPIIFHHVEGQEKKLPDSPSWMNTAELNVVKSYLEELVTQRGVNLQEVGVISPYRKQCSLIRKWLEEQGWGAIDVGTVEVFQGNERKVIIISTVRSQKRGEELQADMKYSIGFLGSFRRTNVALSRARALVVIVGNLELLSQDETWMKVLREAVRMGGLRKDGGKARPTWIGNAEAKRLLPSVAMHRAGGPLRDDSSYSAEVDPITGRVRIKTSYQGLIVVDDGVRRAQGTGGLGLGTSNDGARFFEEDEENDEQCVNPEAAWREFE